MILLVWNSCGEAEPQFYEFPEGKLADLAKTCDGYMINAASSNEIADKLDELLIALSSMTCRRVLGAPFGPYSAIYVSGFIP